MMKRRVVVTGLGMLSPVGNTVEDSWKAICDGKSGIKLVDFFDVTDFSSKISGSVKNFDPTQYLAPKEVRKIDPVIQFGIAASDQAIKDANLSIDDDCADKIGVAIGAGLCGLTTMEDSHSVLMKSGPRKLSPFFIPAIVTNMVSGNVSIKFGLKGPNVSIVSACATGTHNIGLGARIIADGDAEVMVCGGAEMATCPMGLGGFSALRALSTRNDEPEKASRPWDVDRDGFVSGDGAGVLVLESLEHAEKRGAKIYAEIAGFGMSGDGYHITSPDPNGDGAIRSMKNALKDANLDASCIDYINAHGTSTPAGDEIEVLAVKKVFDEHAYKLAMSSTKSMTGHMLGATGAVEAIFCILAVRDQIAPPTINLDNPSEGCDLNLVPHKAEKRKIEVALSNSFGFGGTNATVIVKKFESNK